MPPHSNVCERSAVPLAPPPPVILKALNMDCAVLAATIEYESVN